MGKREYTSCTGCSQKMGIRKWYIVCFTTHLIWNLEYSSENWDPYVCSKYKTNSERYQEWILYYTKINRSSLVSCILYICITINCISISYRVFQKKMCTFFLFNFSASKMPTKDILCMFQHPKMGRTKKRILLLFKCEKNWWNQ